MSRCSKGKSCGSTCIERRDLCRKTLGSHVSQELSQMSAADIFNLAIQEGEKLKKQPKKDLDSLVFDDISRILRGEEPLLMQDTRQGDLDSSARVSLLQSALGMGPQTRREVGSDMQTLWGEAQRVREQVVSELERTQSSKRIKELAGQLKKLDRALAPNEGSGGQASWRKKDAKIFDSQFQPTKKYGNDYDWSETLGKGSRSLGHGSYGSVIGSPTSSTVVKRGYLTQKEIEIMKKISGKDVGPSLIAAEINTTKTHPQSKDLVEGRVAMSEVPGKTLTEFKNHRDKVGDTTIGDAYWSLRKRLHSAGVAHNDPHVDNVIIDKNGKARFVDFGFSQDNPKAALSEAIGIFSQRMYLPQGVVSAKPLAEGGDLIARKYEQFSPWAEGSYSMVPGSNLDKIVRNRTSVFQEMKRLGLNNNDIAEVVTLGTQQPLSRFEKGGWGKLSNSDAEKLISILYKGVD